MYVNISNVTSRSVTINWTEPFDNYDPIIGYDIWYRNPRCLVFANGLKRRMVVSSIEEQVTITDLHPGRYYIFFVVALNDICPSEPSDPVYVHTLEEGMW